VLVLGIAYHGVAIPLLCHVLPQIGTSRFEQRQAILDEFLQLFPAVWVSYLTADREFTVI
jgi:hypothetical protein